MEYNMNSIMKILAIDDNQDNLISIKALIKEAFPDARIFTALTGEKGLELTIAEDPDVILLDIVMPGMDGFEVCGRLKADKMLCDIPVVFVTAIKGDKESRIRALECGAEAFLAKPIDEYELTAQIRAMVKIKQANTDKRDETKRLATLVAERTQQLENELVERKRVERSLKESEERFQLLFNEAPLGYQSLDFDGCFIEVNQQWLNTLGYTRDEVLGKWFGDFLSPAYQDGFRKRFPIFKAQGNIHSEFEMVHKNGQVLFIAFEGKIGYDLKGNFKQTHCILQDITISKQTEDALKASEVKHRTILQTALDGFWLVDLQGNFIDVNDSYCRMTGYSVWELLTMNISDLEAVETINETVHRINRIKIKGEDRFESIHRHKDGRLINVEVSVQYQIIESGLFVVFVKDITEHKQAVAALRESEEQYRLLHESSGIAVGYYKPDGTVISYNRVAASNMKGNPDDFIGKSIYELFPKQEAEIYHNRIKKAILSNESNVYEDMVPLPIGNNYFLSTIAKIVDKQNNILGIQIVSQNITERKLAEKALRESEEKYRTIFENVQDVFYKTDLAGNLDEISPSIKYYTDFDRNEILNTPVTNLYANPDDRKLVVDELLKSGEIRDFEIKIKTKNGNIRYGSINARLIVDFEGKPDHIEGAIRDVTERKLAEETIRTTKILLEQTLEQSPVPMLLVSMPDAIIRIANPASIKFLGIEDEPSVINQPLIDIIPSWQDFDMNNQPGKIEELPLARSLRGQKTEGEERRIVRKDGSICYELVNSFPITDDAGNIIAGYLIMMDITDRKQAELLLQEKTTEIETQNEALIQTNKELIKAKEKAEESDHLKSAFLANMSHEIRTPMNSIMGFASLLPEEDSFDLIANYAKIIVRSSEQLVHIIDDIVLYSRLQTKLLSNTPTPFNVHNLLSDVKQSFSLPEFQKEIELNIETTSEIPIWVSSDYEKLRQIFTNLISNAFKYTFSGSITIGFIQNEKEFEFFVRDTGLGIPPNEVENVFERFFRGSNVNKGVIGGTGLGLSIVKELTELLGGKIWVESEEGKGSTFSFTLPKNM